MAQPDTYQVWKVEVHEAELPTAPISQVPVRAGGYSFWDRDVTVSLKDT